MDAIFDRRPPSAFRLFYDDPVLFIAEKVYHRYVSCLVPGRDEGIRVVCISDTHMKHSRLPPLPEGDILVHSGDLTHSGRPEEVHEALQWLSEQPHTHKIFIAGNHDFALSAEHNPSRDEILAAFPDLIYLDDTSTELVVRGRTIHVYGNPWTSKHGSWAFQYPSNQDEERWRDVIPPHTDLLITHGPPAYHCDSPAGYGSPALLRAVWQVRPILHVFGHIHVGRGTDSAAWTSAQAAYERIRGRTGGRIHTLSSLCRLLVDAASAALFGGVHAQTVFVNAACIAGMRDDKVRGASVVDM